MPVVLQEVAEVTQEAFARLEMEFDAAYSANEEAHAESLRADVNAAVKLHRLGVVANKLQPQVVARGDDWKEYLRSRGKALRTVQRGQLLAEWVDEATISAMRVAQAEDLALGNKAVARRQVNSLPEWYSFKANMAKLEAALLKEESECDEQLADLQEKLEADLQKEIDKRKGELETAATTFSRRIQAEAKAQIEENAEILNGAEMAEALAADGRASIPKPRAQGDTMPSEVVAELGESEQDEQDDDAEEGDLLDADQIEQLAERLQELVITRPNDLTDARTDPQVQAALDNLLVACNGDAEIVFGVVSVWFVNSGL